MPNWKKVIVSGSSASLNSLIVANGITGSLFGTASWAENAITASYALNAEVSIDTGSFLITASISDDTITFTKGDTSTFDLVVNNVATASYALTASVAFAFPDQGYQHVQSTPSTTWSITHSLNTLTPLVDVYDNSYNQLIPAGIQSIDVNTTEITFSTGQTGYAIISKGSGINSDIAVSASYATTASYAITSSLPLQGIITASAVNTTITFTKGDGTTFDVTTSIISGSVASASYSNYAVSASYAATASSADTFIVRNSLTASGLNYPTVDGLENQVLETDGNGNLIFDDIHTMLEDIYSGEALTKGDPLYISGSQGAKPIVYKADAADPAKMPVAYIALETIGAGADTRGIILGLIEGMDLTGYPAGTEVYVAAGGGWTSTRPTGSAIVQVLGVVTKEGSGGKGLVLNPGPANLPNLQSGSLWVGNNNGVPVAIATSSIQNVVSSSYATTASYASTVGVNFEQVSPSSTWTINHNLNNRHPLVQIYDSSHLTLIPQSISGSDVNTTIVTFSFPISGYARIV